MEAKNSGQLTVAGTRGFLPVWLAWVTVGETLGFLVPILTHLTASLFVPDFIFPLLVGAGAVEGAVLGWAQAHVLRPRLPDLSGRRWIILTSLGAAAAWVIGMLPSAAAAVWERWHGLLRCRSSPGHSLPSRCSAPSARHSRWSCGGTFEEAFRGFWATERRGVRGCSFSSPFPHRSGSQASRPPSLP